MADTMVHERSQSPSSFIEKIDEIVHTPLQEFDAFPKLPETYKARSESRGFLTLFVTFLAFLLVLNDLGEYIWGWPDYEFSVDRGEENNMKINLDMLVNMPCQCECAAPLPLQKRARLNSRVRPVGSVSLFFLSTAWILCNYSSIS